MISEIRSHVLQLPTDYSLELERAQLEVSKTRYNILFKLPIYMSLDTLPQHRRTDLDFLTIIALTDSENQVLGN